MINSGSLVRVKYHFSFPEEQAMGVVSGDSTYIWANQKNFGQQVFYHEDLEVI